MQLTGRLMALAKWVPACSNLADIGTDHAFLPAFLVEGGRVGRAIATEARPGPLAAAARELRKQGLQDRVELRLGDGLKPLRPGEVETITVAGMGAFAVCGVLESEPSVLESLRLLLLQPMGGASPVRRWLMGHGWRIIDEDLVLEHGRFYEMLFVQEGFQKMTEQEIEVGPVLLARRHPLLLPYLEKRARRWRRAREGLAKGAPGNAERLGQVREILEVLEGVRSWLRAAGK